MGCVGKTVFSYFVSDLLLGNLSRGLLRDDGLPLSLATQSKLRTVAVKAKCFKLRITFFSSLSGVF